MNVAKLAERQLFLMKAENLEKRVRAYYAQTQDVDSLIEYGVAILVRSFFCMGSFAELIQDLIQEVSCFRKSMQSIVSWAKRTHRHG